uniref:uroporphyrinogen-III synthase n=1 Tax=Lysinibacillus fusiformis TaxID=28031 RepID=UPI00201C8883
MPSNLPLQGKTILLTGTSKTTTIVDNITALGGHAIIAPLIETCERLDNHDAERLNCANQFDWLIFTSQNTVYAFA